MGSRRGAQRTDRVGQQIWELLASLLLFDVSDPRLKRIQVTGVDVAPDLKHANVFYIVIDRESPEPDEEVAEAVGRSAGFLRKMLGDKLTMKFVPELHFKYDESVERGRRIDRLLADIVPGEEE